MNRLMSEFMFGGLRFMSKQFPSLLKTAVQISFLREVLLAIPVSIRSHRMSVRDALSAIDDLANRQRSKRRSITHALLLKVQVSGSL